MKKGLEKCLERGVERGWDKGLREELTKRHATTLDQKVVSKDWEWGLGEGL